MNEQRKLVFDTLDRSGIKYEVVEHPAVATIEEMDALGFDTNHEVVKNLFLCDDKKKRFFLISLAKEKMVNLKELRDKLDFRPLSFASATRLESILGLQKGEITPLGILNDKECIVEVIFDNDIRSFKRVGVHPNDNTATIWILPTDLEKIIREHGNRLSYMNI